MDHNEFFKSIKDGNYKSVYLFHGEEEYVKEQAFDTIRKQLFPQFEELNLSIFDIGTADEIIGACDVAPFMADMRMTVCRFIPKDKDAKKLIEYMEKMPTECIMLFIVRGKADSKLGIIKKIKALGGEVIFDYLNDNEAVRWVMQNAIKSGCTINSSDALFMIQLVGHDMLSIRNELSKLCDYVGQGGVITKEIITNVVIKNLEFQLYNTYAFFTNGKFQDGFRSLENITDGKDRDSEAMGIAGYFLSCLKAALVAHDLQAKKASQAEMEALTGKRGYALKDLCTTAKKFTRSQLLYGIIAFTNVSRTKIVLGQSSYNALIDAINTTFIHLKK